MSLLVRGFFYILRGRFWNDLSGLLKNRWREAPEIIFFAGSQVDLRWILPIYHASVLHGIRCTIAGPDLKLSFDAAYYDISAHVLRFMKGKVMLTATTGLAPHRMPRLATHNIAVPHSLVSFHMVYPAGTFDGYTDVFCSGEHHLGEIHAMNKQDGLPNRRSVLIGYEDEAARRLSTMQLTPEKNRRGHVLIGPSWAPGNILDTMGEPLIEELLSMGYFVTLRPHPAFFSNPNRVITPIVDRFTGCEGFRLERSTEESAALFTADLLISDYSGFALEFAFIRERPVLYVDVPKKQLNANWEALGLPPLELAIRTQLGALVQPKVADVLNKVPVLIDSGSLWADGIRSLRAKYWANYGNYANAALSELQRMLSQLTK